jgi:acetylornithine deacetylase/succinyl-diaminopimelate desuccinylase-like protein
MAPSDKIDLFYEANRDRIISEWMEFLRFASVSADPGRRPDCRRCAAWLRAHLEGIGLAAELVETTGNPLVLAERKGTPDRPTLLVYGHYDVQPVDPVDGWHTPPFEPCLRDGRVYARGAEDNKGQIFYVIKAIEALLRGGGLDATVKVIVEGEEEHGSAGILEFLDRQPRRAAADVLLVQDTQVVSTGQPTLVMGLRGVVNLTTTLDGASHDLHSGIHGGVAPNAATGMARLLASLHDAEGRVAVKGFYDGVTAPTERERLLANSVPFDAAAYRRETGVPPVAGEKGFSPAERTGFRPCLDINGIHGGYGGAGGKTIIPGSVTAKISARTVAGQDPKLVLDAIVSHLRNHTPEGLRLGISDCYAPGPGFRLDLESKAVRRAGRILESVCGGPVAYLWEGASIPVVARLATVSGAEPLLIGFGEESDRIHAPNESFSLAQFRKGLLFAAAFLADRGA